MLERQRRDAAPAFTRCTRLDLEHAGRQQVRGNRTAQLRLEPQQYALPGRLFPAERLAGGVRGVGRAPQDQRRPARPVQRVVVVVKPPARPIVTVTNNPGEIVLAWTDTSEVVTDPLSGENDFVGYKLYRSDNQGKTWGRANYNTGNNCLTMDYVPVKNFSVPAPGGSGSAPHSHLSPAAAAAALVAASVMLTWGRAASAVSSRS